jgi:ribosomal protein S1/(E)-4-hydroxy-3-methyl-but-2-enyl pyrophosphate reductase
LQVITGKQGGFCLGVRLAVDTVIDSINQYGNVYTCGPIIHNKNVVDELKEKGALPVESLQGLENCNLVIRSHGVPPEIYDECEKRNINVIDATCPYVKRIHETVKANSDLGNEIIIIGEKHHPEVIGTNGWSGGKARILYSKEDVEALPQISKACVVAQTTITPEKWDEIVTLLQGKVRELELSNTICQTTVKRQEETIQIAQKADIMLVIGGRNSSNTQKLAEISIKYCPKTYSIAQLEDVPLAIMNPNDIIGIVAGASTPDGMIREVITIMDELERVEPVVSSDKEEIEPVECALEPEVKEIPVSTAPEEKEPVECALEPETEEKPVSAEPEEKEPVECTLEPETEELPDPAEPEEQTIQEADPAALEDDFAHSIDKTLVQIRPGQVLKGNVVQITDNEVCVNIGYKSDGLIPRSELSLEGDVNPRESCKVGDEVTVEVVKVNDGEGNVLLSKKSVDARKILNKYVESVESGEVFEAVVKEAVNGGLVALCKNVIKVFIPASHVSVRFVQDLSKFVGQTLQLKAIEVDKKRKRIVASHKLVLQEDMKRKEEEVWGAFKPGDRVKGKVMRLTDFGAFVDIGGVDGLVHVSDLSWGKVKHPSDVIKPGEEIEVEILSLDPERRRISLGYKQCLAKPWETAVERFPVGTIVEGRVARIVPFGAFVELAPGLDGLIHISQVSTKRIDKVESELKPNDTVRVKVLEVNPADKRISLSRRDVLLEEQHDDQVESDKNVDSAEDNFEIPPIQETKVTLGDYFPQSEDK